MNRYWLILWFVCVFTILNAQEFNCRVSVTAPKMTGEYASQVNKNIFTTLEQGIAAFINENKWTEYNFDAHEKIECSIQLVIEKALAVDQFAGKIYIQLSRPVFNSTYTTPIFAYQDQDLAFKYSENQTFDYDESSYLWTITSLVAFYANLMLGITFDTYALQGGTPYYIKALNIAGTAPSSESGWSTSSKDTRNRYWLANSYYNDPNSNVFRNFLYQYHRLGLDIMHQDLTAGYNVVLSSLESLQEVHRKSTNMYCLNIIGMYKSTEFVNMFSAAEADIKQKALKILQFLDPTNSSKYENLQ